MAIKNDTLDQLLSERSKGGVFQRRLFAELKKALAERVLNAELDDRLIGEEGAGKANHRNGYSKKTVLTETSRIDIKVPRIERHFRSQAHFLASMRFGDGNDSQDSEVTLIRCMFVNNTIARVSVESWNVLDIWVWYSYNTFLNSSVADLTIDNTQFFGIRGNYSSGSNQFFHESDSGQNTSWLTIQGNTILDTTNPVAIEVLNPAVGAHRQQDQEQIRCSWTCSIPPPLCERRQYRVHR